MEQYMVLTKDKNSLGILIAILVILPVYVHGYCIWKGGFTNLALKVHLYILPFSIVFLLLSYGIFRSLKNKLVVSDSGLLVEDFSRIEFPWRVIRGASTKSQLLPRGGAVLWLVLHTTCDDNYSSLKIRRLNRMIGFDGIPVCNLLAYSGCAEKLLGIIKKRCRNA
ncbi:hypothetical protein [Microbulbifer sp. JMSA003]|uniref:hypothetical protein n=1 Tax=Microbulbifer sp. JMSA003 TaxID=3243369 RepID=UPI00403A078C